MVSRQFRGTRSQHKRDIPRPFRPRPFVIQIAATLSVHQAWQRPMFDPDPIRTPYLKNTSSSGDKVPQMEFGTLPTFLFATVK